MTPNTPQLPPVSPIYEHSLKRPLDLLLSVGALLLLLPLLLVLALLLWWVQGGNPLFLQTRVGRGGRYFRIIKFRTMNDTRNSDGELLPDARRTTRIGALLRRSSLDELPELLNVIRGDMSLIGPRPWIPEQMAHFSPSTQERRMRLRPGISGLAQVMGRNNLTFRQRLRYDLLYRRHLSPETDLWILWRTCGRVLQRDGIEQHPNAFGTTDKRTATR